MASSSSTSQTLTSKTFTGLGNLIKLLPTGTVFLFQFFNPVVTDAGHCTTATNKILTTALLVACAFNCCFACFTDSYMGSDKQRHYGIVTIKGLWPAPASDKVDMAKYKLRVGDFAHALLGLIVFAVLALLDANTVSCFYRRFESAQKILIQVIPPVIGVAAGAVFMLFPNTRHGIGYPFTSGVENNNDNSKDKKETTNNTKRAGV
ncbi:protein DMP2-like [Prosopis cineraria]|uniref:protein DMP2-like n=1 Tax=Prosopis cineraria TaxID=364024 RepID=UPI0024107C89|nr:protein DMP2-like [Prosopis cineraria]